MGGSVDKCLKVEKKERGRMTKKGGGGRQRGENGFFVETFCINFFFVRLSCAFVVWLIAPLLLNFFLKHSLALL